MSSAGKGSVVVLGGGPAGVGAAYRLAARGVPVTVLEAGDRVGGLAGSTTVSGVRVDFGSHRLHPSIAPGVLADLQRLPDVHLQRRERHGRIRLARRWVGFPQQIADAARQLPPRFVLGLARDAVTGPVRRPRADTFDEVLRAGVGPTLAARFYAPYARKIWGVEPAELSGDQARRRVGANSLLAIAARALRGHRERPWFWYPSTGFGALSDGLAAAARAHGADIRLGARVSAVAQRARGWTVTTADGATASGAHVWSTLPLPQLAGMLEPVPPTAVLAAAGGLRYRAMLLIYLTFDVRRYTPYDAHYLPEAWTPVTRISEPRNYRDGPDPDDRTVLCAELPCAVGDRWWSASDDELGAVVTDTLARADLPRHVPRAVTVHRRRHAYPIATGDAAARLRGVERWLAGLPGLLTLGRQGLFAHDNTHHALAMAWAAAEALTPAGALDRASWTTAREGFRAHVVED